MTTSIPDLAPTTPHVQITMDGWGPGDAPAPEFPDGCDAVTDLFAGTPESGSVILSCGSAPHPDYRAHRMLNNDGSITTWR